MSVSASLLLCGQTFIGRAAVNTAVRPCMSDEVFRLSIDYSVIIMLSAYELASQGKWQFDRRSLESSKLPVLPACNF